MATPSPALPLPDVRWLRSEDAAAPPAGCLAARPAGSLHAAAFRIVAAGAGEEELSQALAHRPEAILLTGCREPGDVGRIANRLAVVEALRGLPWGETRLILAFGSSAAVLAAAAIAAASPRIGEVGLDLQELADEIGVPAGTGAPAEGLAKAAILLAARSRGLPAFVRLPPGIDPGPFRAEGFDRIAS